MYIDTHCHLNFKVFSQDWRQVANQAVSAGVEKMIVVGADMESSIKAVKLAEKHPNLWAAIGIHPHHVQSNIDLEKLEKLAKSKKVAAIGECGLDYHVYEKSRYENLEITPKIKIAQKRLFGQQIQLAKKMNLPIIIHNREAGEDTLDVLRHFSTDDGYYPLGVFHCISGGKKLLKKILEAGFFIGVDGNIVYSQEVQIMAAESPLEKIVLETDAPYLSADRSGDRNTPETVKIVAQYLAKLKNIPIKKVEQQTALNAHQLFKL